MNENTPPTHTATRRPWSPLIEAENKKRELRLDAIEHNFDPYTGYFPEDFDPVGCTPTSPRILVDDAFRHARRLAIPLSETLERDKTGAPSRRVRIPLAMAADPALHAVATRRQWQILRFKHDFAYWAATCVTIKDKSCGRRIPFILNYAQRRLLHDFERQRTLGMPIRSIVLKARQWGGSTLTQMYMAWIQCVLTTDWHSLICTQVTRASANIRGMFDAMLATYPANLWIDAETDGSTDTPSTPRPRTAPRTLKLTPFQGQAAIRTLPGRRCNITLGSAESQDSVRSGDYSLAHLSEVAFWKESPQSSPADFIRAICGSVAPLPLSMVVLESTANGIGNYFHSEWVRSVRGESDKSPIFVPWYEIAIYRARVPDPSALWQSLTTYEHQLWQQHGCSLSQIQWYRNKLRESGIVEKMQAEFPTTPAEAFINSGCNVFANSHVERLRTNCSNPSWRGEITARHGTVIGPPSLIAPHFAADTNGNLSVWQHPQANATYIAAVDIGGRSRQSDWSVIAVLRSDSHTPEVVAQWRGHTDHDLLAWNAARIAAYYNHALLAFESNTLESDTSHTSAYILQELYRHYDNLYLRNSPLAPTSHIGFHTNRSTKPAIIAGLIAAVRDGLYIERSHIAADELLMYQMHPNGAYAAPEGFHDDCLITRAIALHLIRSEHPQSYSVNSNRELARYIRRIRSA